MNLKTVEKNNQNFKYVGFTECVKETVENFTICIFPGYFASNKNIPDFHISLCNLLKYVIKDSKQHKLICSDVDIKINELKKLVYSDIEAAYIGDPAATSIDEIILCYPAIRAITAYRLAHLLYELEIPIIPRAIMEYEHRLTGIDIHPGAKIGSHFFIDHGTGVVIGQTCIIGNNVKLYQHVTLGAKSFDTDDEGHLIKGIKRHPNIEDNVVIYAGATILGNITIGESSIIGGNVWLTHSVPKNSKISK